MLPSNAQPPKLKETDLLLAAEREETSTARTNFPEIVKAKVFARDKGICAFSGLNLWLLDEGACGFYNVTWIDHIIPATRGGTSDEENGVATHWAYNYNKSNNMGGNIYLFMFGVPTYRYWEYHRRLTPEIATALMDNQFMHYSDWYFNQALTCVIWGLIWLHGGRSASYKRDDIYYAQAALKKLEKWRKIVKDEKIEPFAERSLLPDPLNADQELLLSLQDKTSVEEIRELMQAILPYHTANYDLKIAFDEAYFNWLQDDKNAFNHLPLDNPLVNKMIVEDLIWNIRMLCDPYHDWVAEDEELLEEQAS